MTDTEISETPAIPSTGTCTAVLLRGVVFWFFCNSIFYVCSNQLKALKRMILYFHCLSNGRYAAQ